MTPKEIKRILFERDLKISGLAREFECFSQELSMCVHQKRPYPELREKLAKKLGMSVEELFGSTKA